MKQGRGHSRRRAARTSRSHRIRPQFLNIDGERVETDLKYWAIHATHWLYTLLAVIAVIVVGLGIFGTQDDPAYAQSYTQYSERYPQ